MVAGWQRYAGDRPGTANRGRMLLDVSWRGPEVTNVALTEHGMDRIRVRLAAVIVVTAQPGWHRIDKATSSTGSSCDPRDNGQIPGPCCSGTCGRCGGRTIPPSTTRAVTATLPALTRRPAGASTVTTWSSASSFNYPGLPSPHRGAPDPAPP